MNENPYEENPAPYLSASNFSKSTFSWIGDLLSLGAKKQLELKDLYSPYPEIQCKTVTDELEMEWQKEQEENPDNPSIIRPLKKLYMWQFIFNSLYIIIQELLKIFQPLFIALILRYFNGTIDLATALVYAGIISVLAAFGGVLHHPYYRNAYTQGMKTRLALSGLMYRKILKVGSTHFESQKCGDIANLLSNDADRVANAIFFLMYLFVGPLQIVVVVSVILSQIGWTFLAGLIFLFALMPIKALLASIYNKFRQSILLTLKESKQMILPLQTFTPKAFKVSVRLSDKLTETEYH